VLIGNGCEQSDKESCRDPHKLSPPICIARRSGLGNSLTPILRFPRSHTEVGHIVPFGQLQDNLVVQPFVRVVCGQLLSQQSSLDTYDGIRFWVLVHASLKNLKSDGILFQRILLPVQFLFHHMTKKTFKTPG
jgi:hypothetical protein